MRYRRTGGYRRGRGSYTFRPHLWGENKLQMGIDIIVMIVMCVFLMPFCLVGLLFPPFLLILLMIFLIYGIVCVIGMISLSKERNNTVVPQNNTGTQQTVNQVVQPQPVQNFAPRPINVPSVQQPPPGAYEYAKQNGLEIIQGAQDSKFYYSQVDPVTGGRKILGLVPMVQPNPNIVVLNNNVQAPVMNNK